MRWLIAVCLVIYGLAGAIYLIHQMVAPVSPTPVMLPLEPSPPDPLDTFILTGLKVVLALVVAGVLASVPALLVMKLAALVYRTWRMADLVPTDEAGRWPVTVTATQDPRYGMASVASWHQTELARALNSGAVPHTFHYEMNGLPQLPPGPPAPDLVTPTDTPTFAALLAAGKFGTDQPLLMGYSEDGPLEGSWKKLYTAAVAGLSGAGKTTTLRFLAGQSALHGARFVILDPHMEAGDDSLADTLAPLQSVFLAPPAREPQDMLTLLARVNATLDLRLHGGARDYPLIVAVDEFTGLMARSDLAEPLARLIERIAQEGRKVGVFALISGQIFTANRAGGSALRDALASAYVHRMKRNQARLLLPTDAARDAETLPTGTALLYQTSGEITRVRVPLTTGADMVAVGRLLGAGGSPAAPATGEPAPATGEPAPATGGRLEMPPATGAEEVDNVDIIDPGETQKLSRPVAQSPDEDPRIAKALFLFDAGAALPDAVSQAFDVGKKSPNSYNKYYAQVQTALREQRQQGG